MLAAGCSRRFGAANKLVAPLDGRPIVRRAGEALTDSGASDVVVVTGYDREAIEAALAGLPVHFVHNDSWSAGMGSSIARGICALRPETCSAFVVPGDMPFLTAVLLRALMHRHAISGDDRIVVPTTCDGAQRNPVLWPRHYFPELAALDGPEGGKELLKRHWKAAAPIPIADASVFVDVDTTKDLSKA